MGGEEGKNQQPCPCTYPHSEAALPALVPGRAQGPSLTSDGIFDCN